MISFDRDLCLSLGIVNFIRRLKTVLIYINKREKDSFTLI